jgi:exopolysaccharide biosynthesis WecB/TagA/CpsF family protein
MINHGKFNILGVNVHAVDYDYAVGEITSAALDGRPCAMSALAVHGVMTGYMDDVHRRRLNGLDLVVPDGQPVRWALKWVHGVALPDRVYGPTLTLKVIAAAAEQGIPLYLYGSKQETLDLLQERLMERWPSLLVVGAEPSRFRRLDSVEKADVIRRIKASGARIVLVGLGCPRQETWAYEYREQLAMPLMAVGAAFDFHAGSLSQAPPWMQDNGLEWLFRLIAEPKRLWRRYLILNPAYLYGILLQRLKIKRTSIEFPNGFEPEESFG